ncbi:aminoglycoside adenylyltransferase family protein [Entomohabitans teleogrylli]|uniref:aminoglycoside adenylyltransferase family protein n=1 Tax=Entomohabitans teleogrylli TaxID=1384589 RepID=UPI00073D2E86|nr:aminoglycoside adenylyltransferase family protein [Entomohabitans teleogrylli]
MTANIAPQTDWLLLALKKIAGEALLAVYLHGSAVAGGLKPHSDIDLLAVIDRSLTASQRARLLAELLQISARYPAEPGGPRCLEVMLFLRADLQPAPFPARVDFIYGEWLREAFEAGAAAAPCSDAEYTLVLAQARQQAHPLFGPPVQHLLPEIAPAQIRRALRDLLPELMANLRGDERNVLLTLARIWYTASSGEWLAKDSAATWALARLPAERRALLDIARRAYRGEITDRQPEQYREAPRLADDLLARITPLL